MSTLLWALGAVYGVYQVYRWFDHFVYGPGWRPVRKRPTPTYAPTYSEPYDAVLRRHLFPRRKRSPYR